MKKQTVNTKSLARIAAVQVIYQIGQNNVEQLEFETLLMKMNSFYSDDSLSLDYEINSNDDLKLKLNKKYFQDLTTYTYSNLEFADIIISQKLINDWQIKGLSNLLLAVLRVGICEIKYFPETPTKVIINEYTDIANDMLGGTETGFVNVVLDKVAKEIREES